MLVRARRVQKHNTDMHTDYRVYTRPNANRRYGTLHTLCYGCTTALRPTAVRGTLYTHYATDGRNKAFTHHGIRFSVRADR